MALTIGSAEIGAPRDGSRWDAGAAPIRYPDPTIKILDPRFVPLVLGNAAIETIATGCRFNEGPVWFGDLRCLVWSDIPNDRMMKWEEETGAVSLVNYVVVDDVGTVINPVTLKGQVHGGLAQGIGQILMEQVSYDRESGQLLSGSFMDYALPRASDLPDIEVELIEVPCASNPLGVKGAGEAGAVGSPPAVMNALVDALRNAGVRAIDMPATPERVWKALHEAQAA